MHNIEYNKNKQSPIHKFSRLYKYPGFGFILEYKIEYDNKCYTRHKLLSLFKIKNTIDKIIYFTDINLSNVLFQTRCEIIGFMNYYKDHLLRINCKKSFGDLLIKFKVPYDLGLTVGSEVLSDIRDLERNKEIGDLYNRENHV